MNASEWKSTQNSENPLVLNGISSASNQDPVYWSAPKRYLGNRITSYGGSISIIVKIEAPTDNDTIAYSGAVLILIGGGMPALAYISDENIPRNIVIYEINIDLIESKFVHLQTGSPVSRRQFMQVLSQLEELKVRATYFNKAHSVKLDDFEMTQTTPSHLKDSSYVAAKSAEKCTCPKNYAGTSCETCDDGFYKVRSGSGPGLFRCVPCSCNGHSSKCDPETGRCIDCQNNAVGDHCEKCLTSYYRVNKTKSEDTFECKHCTCPGPLNVFADSCYYEPKLKKVAYCSCHEGYKGTFCEACASGYYGEPSLSGGKCQSCKCNTNIGWFDLLFLYFLRNSKSTFLYFKLFCLDKTDPEACDSRTGKCKCLYNTTGNSCERCLDWYFGDALELKNCQACDCNQVGASRCDNSTGVCECRPNVQGESCTQCKENFWGFDRGIGCDDCACNSAGSISVQCDQKNGQCTCKPGVDGVRCDQCKPGFWKFTEAGCEPCQCRKEGTVAIQSGGYACDAQTGACKCITGMEGQDCGQCKPRWALVENVGCKECNMCTHTLLDELEITENKTRKLDADFLSLDLLTKLIENLEKMDDNYTVYYAQTKDGLDKLPFFKFRKIVEETRYDLFYLNSLVLTNFTEKFLILTELHSYIADLDKKVNVVRDSADRLDYLIEELSRELESNAVSDERLAIYEGIVTRLVTGDYMNKFNIEKSKALIEINSYKEGIEKCK